jgi:hypothetical protein
MSGILSAVSGILAAVSQRDFWSEGQIKEFVRQSSEKRMQALYGHTADANAGIGPNDLRAMLIFVAEKQQTWLVAGSLTAYCVLDDRSREEPRILWTKRLVDTLPVQTAEIQDRNRSAKAGVLRFGSNSKDWMYSKNLFAYEDVQEAVTRFLSASDG